MTQNNPYGPYSGVNNNSADNVTPSTSDLPTYDNGFEKVREPAPYVPEDVYAESSNPESHDEPFNDPYSASSANQSYSPVSDQNSASEEQSTYRTEQPLAPAYGGPQWSSDSQQEAHSDHSSNYQQYSQQPSGDLNIKSLLGLIFSFVFFPAGLILSWLGFKESKTTGDDTGKILAIVGLVVSGIQLLSMVLFFAFFFFMIILGAMSGGM